MSKPLSISLIVFFSLALVGLLIYVTVSFFNSKGTNNKKPEGEVSTQNDMNDFVQWFRSSFQSWSGYACDPIEEANNFDNTKLSSFAITYLSTFGISAVEEMDNAWVWCLKDPQTARSLYNKLKAL